MKMLMSLQFNLTGESIHALSEVKIEPKYPSRHMNPQLMMLFLS